MMDMLVVTGTGVEAARVRKGGDNCEGGLGGRSKEGQDRPGRQIRGKEAGWRRFPRVASAAFFVHQLATCPYCPCSFPGLPGKRGPENEGELTPYGQVGSAVGPFWPLGAHAATHRSAFGYGSCISVQPHQTMSNLLFLAILGYGCMSPIVVRGLISRCTVPQKAVVGFNQQPLRTAIPQVLPWAGVCGKMIDGLA